MAEHRVIFHPPEVDWFVNFFFFSRVMFLLGHQENSGYRTIFKVSIVGKNDGSFYLFIYLFIFPRLHPWHTEVPRLGVESER